MTKVGFHKSRQGWFTEERIAEIKKRLTDEYGFELVEVDFRDGVLVNGKVYVGDTCLNDLDVYFWHDTIWPSLTGSDSYYLHLLRSIGEDAVVVNTADSTELVNDKFRAHSKLRSCGIPVSSFALVRSDRKEGIARAFNDLGGPVLIKPRFGGWGTGVVKCQTLDELSGVIELSVSVNAKHQQFLLEKFYENDPAKWTSISMVAQQPVIAYRKPLSLGGSDWKVYDPDKRDGRGDASEYVEPPEDLVGLACKAQKAIGKDFIGFDFISTNEGYIIVDENGRPGLYEHCLAAAGVDLVDVIAKLIAGKVTTRGML